MNHNLHILVSDKLSQQVSLVNGNVPSRKFGSEDPKIEFHERRTLIKLIGLN